MLSLPLPEGVPVGVEVWQIELPLGEPLRADDLAVLSDSEVARAQRFQRHEDRVRSVATRAALRRLLAERLGLSARSLNLVAGPHGKPALAGLDGPDFNVSHAGAYALVALSSEGCVGVDIECCNRDVDREALAPLVESPAESQAAAPITFFERWVVKEAALKALGLGVAEHLRSLSVWPAPGGTARYRLEAARADWPQLRAWRLSAPSNHVAALAHAAGRCLPSGDSA